MADPVRRAGASEAGLGFREPGAPSLDDVTLAQVTAHGWRMSDGRLPQGHPMRVLAFIESCSDAFEVLQLGAGFEWHVFESLDLAVAFVIETGPRLAQQRVSGDLGRPR